MRFLATRLAASIRPGTTRSRGARFIGNLSSTAGSQQPALYGVARALQDNSETPEPTLLQDEFSLTDKVALVTGANRGLGLEGALAFAEAGARAVYCLDVGASPGDSWTRVRDFVSRMQRSLGEVRFEYIQADVSDQEKMWQIGKMIGDREGRMDVCWTAAGLAPSPAPSLYLSDKALQEILDVNLKGTLYTAQAAGQQMERFGSGGSIILAASILGQITINQGATSYEVSKGAVQQLARSLACELAPSHIRVNSVSPGFMNTPMVEASLAERHQWSATLHNRIPVKRLAHPHELRGVLVWLASNASSFCTGSNVVVDGGHRAC
ncbi:NAD-P-binding protein [Trametes polyzona]|nr:NAD-P-binding protein [Trametes polyzona]